MTSAASAAQLAINSPGVELSVTAAGRAGGVVSRSSTGIRMAGVVKAAQLVQATSRPSLLKLIRASYCALGSTPEVTMISPASGSPINPREVSS